MVLRGAFRRVVVGLVLGLPLAVGAGHLLSAQLYGVQFWDPLALGVAAVLARRLRVRRGDHPGRARGVDFADERAPRRIGANYCVTRRGWIGATRQRMYATNVAIASSTIVMTAELTSPRAR